MDNCHGVIAFGLTFTGLSGGISFVSLKRRQIADCNIARVMIAAGAGRSRNEHFWVLMALRYSVAVLFFPGAPDFSWFCLLFKFHSPSWDNCSEINTSLEKAYWALSYWELYWVHSPNGTKTRVKKRASMNMKYVTAQDFGRYCENLEMSWKVL